MDDFSYLSVLLSIVLGLGITNLLTGLAAMVRNRARMKMYWPMPVWMVTLFLIHVQTWWAMFGLRNVGRWSFAAFLVVLLQPVLLFLMAALIVPDLENVSEPIDLRAAYFRESRWLFSAFVLTLCVSLSKDLVLSGHLPEPRNVVAHGFFFAGAAVGFISKNDRVQKILAPLGLAMLVFYIGLLFTTLPR